MPSVIYRSVCLVEAYGSVAGRIVTDDDGWHCAYDLDWRPVGRWSTERRAAHALDSHMLRRLYRPRRGVMRNAT